MGYFLIKRKHKKQYGEYHQGRYKPANPSKYKGNPTNIIYRSSWELKLFYFLDHHKDVIWWKSEELAIPYRHPLDGKIHRYFVDVICHRRKTDGTFETTMIEVKPAKEVNPPKITKRKSEKTILRETTTYAVNDAKWKAAKSYCEDRGWKFIFFTEKELGV